MYLFKNVAQFKKNIFHLSLKPFPIMCKKAWGTEVADPPSDLFASGFICVTYVAVSIDVFGRSITNLTTAIFHICG